MEPDPTRAGEPAEDSNGTRDSPHSRTARSTARWAPAMRIGPASAYIPSSNVDRIVSTLPPGRWRASRTTTCRPAFCNTKAARRPARPAPTTTTGAVEGRGRWKSRAGAPPLTDSWRNCRRLTTGVLKPPKSVGSRLTTVRLLLYPERNREWSVPASAERSDGETSAPMLCGTHSILRARLCRRSRTSRHPFVRAQT